MLTPSLWANFLMTPSCGDRITVSIFMDSMLQTIVVSGNPQNVNLGIMHLHY